MINRRSLFKILGLGSLTLISERAEDNEVPLKGRQLDKWKESTRHPVKASRDAKVQELIEASQHGRPVSLHYYGGSSSGRFRKVTVEWVFKVEHYSPLYMVGYCHQRCAHRIFRCDRLDLA